MNGWKNRETWLVNLWFEFEDKIELDEIRETIEDQLDEIRRSIPEYMVDMLGVNFVVDEIDWNQLASSRDS
jgi:hypothetical protein|tara:strand:+ start:992 stop:1204 length:213 start_codon:yes stop_codon:yes gene_type:complete